MNQNEIGFIENKKKMKFLVCFLRNFLVKERD